MDPVVMKAKHLFDLPGECRQVLRLRSGHLAFAQGDFRSGGGVFIWDGQKRVELWKSQAPVCNMFEPENGRLALFGSSCEDGAFLISTSGEMLNSLPYSDFCSDDILEAKIRSTALCSRTKEMFVAMGLYGVNFARGNDLSTTVIASVSFEKGSLIGRRVASPFPRGWDVDLVPWANTVLAYGFHGEPRCFAFDSKSGGSWQRRPAFEHALGQLFPGKNGSVISWHDECVLTRFAASGAARSMGRFSRDRVVGDPACLYEDNGAHLWISSARALSCDDCGLSVINTRTPKKGKLSVRSWTKRALKRVFPGTHILGALFEDAGGILVTPGRFGGGVFRVNLSRKA